MKELLHAYTSKLALAAGFVMVSCAPVAPGDSSAPAITQISLRDTKLSTNEFTGLSSDYCYALHVTSKSINELHDTEWNDNDPNNPLCKYSPPTLGALVGMASSDGVLNADLPIGTDIRIDLIGFKKQSEFVTFGPSDVCENYVLENIPGSDHTRLRLRNKVDDKKSIIEDDEVANESFVQLAKASKFKIDIFASKSAISINPGLNAVTLDLVPPIAGQAVPRQYDSCKDDTSRFSDLLQVSTTNFVFSDTITLSGTCKSLPTDSHYALINENRPYDQTAITCNSNAFTVSKALPVTPVNADFTYSIGVVDAQGNVYQVWAPHPIAQRYCTNAVRQQAALGSPTNPAAAQQWFANASISTSRALSDTDGNTAASPIYICTAQQLQNLAYLDYSNASNQWKHFELAADINLATLPTITTSSLNGSNWQSIGALGSTGFEGYLDGKNFTIANMYIYLATNTSYYAGLFGYVESTDNTHVTSISNLKMLNPKIASSVNTTNITSFSGALIGASINGVKVSNVVVTTTLGSPLVSAPGHAGGLIGSATVDGVSLTPAPVLLSQVKIIGDITDAIGNSSVSSCGGLIGNLSATSNTNTSLVDFVIDRSLYKGTLRGLQNVGAFIGTQANGQPTSTNSRIINSYSVTSIYALAKAGGAIGYWQKGMNLQQSYFTTAFHYLPGGTPTTFGGLFGSMSYARSSMILGTVSNTSYSGFSTVIAFSLAIGVNGAGASDYTNSGSSYYIQPTYFTDYLYNANPSPLCSGCGGGPATITSAPYIEASDGLALGLVLSAKLKAFHAYPWDFDNTWLTVVGDTPALRWEQ